MTLRPEYALGHSQYNAFLFAPVGQESTGQELTALTLLTRLGIDPWLEAARLSDLPKDAAARAFAATIVRLPQEDRRGWDAEAIAQRVVNCLPAASVAPVPLVPGAPAQRDGRNEGKRSRVRQKPTLARWLLWGALAVAVVLLVYHLQGGHELEPARSPDTAHTDRS